MEDLLERFRMENKALRHNVEEKDALVENATILIDQLQAESKAKDEVLRELLAYAEEGLLIDEHLAAHIEQSLKGGE